MADFLFQVDGFCPVCGLPATFAARDPWLRDPFLRTRGTHPLSWPRRHLMLSVLRH